MTLNIGQLIEDAERIRQNLVDKQLSVQRNSGDESALRFTRDILAMSNIIDYLKERYVPPSDVRPVPPEPTPAEYPPGYTRK